MDAIGDGPRPRMTCGAGTSCSTDGERQPAEVAVGRRRAHPRVPGPEGRPRHHERRRDRHALRVVRDTWCAPAHPQRQRARVYRSDPTSLPTPNGLIARWVIRPRPGSPPRVQLPPRPRPRLQPHTLVPLVNSGPKPSCLWYRKHNPVTALSTVAVFSGAIGAIGSPCQRRPQSQQPARQTWRARARQQCQMLPGARCSSHCHRGPC